MKNIWKSSKYKAELFSKSLYFHLNLKLKFIAMVHLVGQPICMYSIRPYQHADGHGHQVRQDGFSLISDTFRFSPSIKTTHFYQYCMGHYATTAYMLSHQKTFWKEEKWSKKFLCTDTQYFMNPKITARSLMTTTTSATTEEKKMSNVEFKIRFNSLI